MARGITEVTERIRSIISDTNLRAMLTLAHAAPPGAFVEVGVFRGGSAQLLYDIARAKGAKLHLFDTFSGMPISNPELGDKHKVDDEFDVTSAELDTMRAAMPLAEFHIGTYPETDPGASLGPIAFIHCDCDQYKSYRAVIDLMWPRVVTGGILLFDDYPYLAGAKRAVEESFALTELEPTGTGRFFVRKRKIHFAT
jgi:O-methyltransferase